MFTLCNLQMMTATECVQPNTRTTQQSCCETTFTSDVRTQAPMRGNMWQLSIDLLMPIAKN